MLYGGIFTIVLEDLYCKKCPCPLLVPLAAVGTLPCASSGDMGLPGPHEKELPWHLDGCLSEARMAEKGQCCGNKAGGTVGPSPSSCISELF